MKVNLARRTIRVFDPEHSLYGEKIAGAWTVVAKSPITLEVDEAPPLGWGWNGDEAAPKFFHAMEI